MSEHKTPESKPTRAQIRLQRSNRYKVLRTIVQVAVLVALVAFAIISIIHSNPTQSRTGTSTQTTAAGTGKGTAQYEGKSFVALSYPGLTKSTSLESRIVNQALFEEQLDALKANGYVTITQDDIINFYLYYGSLPDKALFLIIEDGLIDTPTLAQSALEKNQYIATLCTYANNLANTDSKFINAKLLLALSKLNCWEMGTDGYRLAYINIFDRYNNFFGQLNAEEFVKIRQYLWRDYNHYLMDFIRDQDRLRVETEAELQTRIKTDYDTLRSDYTAALGYVPSLYVLMHSNTGAFATDGIASEANRQSIMNLFAMNFNREGTCLNTLDSSIYDLSRLQVQSYFSTNHLLMRMQDDTGEATQFLTGDEEESHHWYLDDGVAQYKGNQIILTSEPAGRGQITLNPRLFSDLDMTVSLQGNLEVWDMSGDGQELFRRNLFEFDGGPYISTQEDERNGLIALQNAIIQFDTDPDRVTKVQDMLAKLQTMPVLMLADGGTPYYPVNDTSERASRKLRIRLVGERMSIWVDDKPIVDQLKVPGVQLGAISLGAKVFQNNDERYTQHNIFDDVYDAVFTDLVISDTQNPDTVLYDYRLTPDQTINSVLTGWFNAVVNFFVDHF